ATLSWALDARTLLQRTVACRYWIRRRRVGSWYTRQIGAACPLTEVEETSGWALINGLLWSLRDPLRTWAARRLLRSNLPKHAVRQQPCFHAAALGLGRAEEQSCAVSGT